MNGCRCCCVVVIVVIVVVVVDEYRVCVCTSGDREALLAEAARDPHSDRDMDLRDGGEQWGQEDGQDDRAQLCRPQGTPLHPGTPPHTVPHTVPQRASCDLMTDLFASRILASCWTLESESSLESPVEMSNHVASQVNIQWALLDAQNMLEPHSISGL